MGEKQDFDMVAADAPPYRNDSIERVVEDKGIRMGEAADMYGDLETAEQYGYVSRGLKSRHIQFIALGGTIGTGLFLGIGRALTAAGPLSILLGYSFVGIAVFGMVSAKRPLCLHRRIRQTDKPLDAISRRDGYVAPFARCYSSVLRSLF